MISRFKTSKDRMKTSLESAPATEYLVDNVTRREPDPLCVQCEEKGCQEGRLVTDYKQSYNGQRVRLVGRNWTEAMKNKVGLVEGFQDHYLRLRWLLAGKLGRKEKKFKLSRVENKVKRFQFQFCCQKDPRHVLFSECCAGKVCPGGPLVTHFESDFVGRQVRYCGETGVGRTWPEQRKQRVLTVEGYENGFLKLKWKGDDLVKKFKLINNSRASGPEFQFRFSCPEDQLNTVEPLVFLSDPQAEILDIDSSSDSETETDTETDSFSHCKLGSEEEGSHVLELNFNSNRAEAGLMKGL